MCEYTQNTKNNKTIAFGNAHNNKTKQNKNHTNKTKALLNAPPQIHIQQPKHQKNKQNIPKHQNTTNNKNQLLTCPKTYKPTNKETTTKHTQITTKSINIHKNKANTILINRARPTGLANKRNRKAQNSKAQYTNAIIPKPRNTKSHKCTKAYIPRINRNNTTKKIIIKHPTTLTKTKTSHPQQIIHQNAPKIILNNNNKSNQIEPTSPHPYHKVYTNKIEPPKNYTKHNIHPYKTTKLQRSYTQHNQTVTYSRNYQTYLLQMICKNTYNQDTHQMKIRKHQHTLQKTRKNLHTIKRARPTGLAHTKSKNKYNKDKNLITTNTKHKLNKTTPKQNTTHNHPNNTTKPTLNNTLPKPINKRLYTTLPYNTHQIHMPEYLNKTTSHKQKQPLHKPKIENKILTQHTNLKKQNKKPHTYHTHKT